MAVFGMAVQLITDRGRPDPSFWEAKVKENVERDKRVDLALAQENWTIVRLRERELKDDPRRAVSSIVSALEIHKKESAKAKIWTNVRTQDDQDDAGDRNEGTPGCKKRRAAGHLRHHPDSVRPQGGARHRFGKRRRQGQSNPLGSLDRLRGGELARARKR